MSAVTHEGLVAAQFGSNARAYVDSLDHAVGADLQRCAALAAARPDGRILDLGCGGGHVSYAVAPHAAEVVAFDLSADMLAVVQDEARGRGLSNLRIERGVAEALPFADASFDLVFTRFSAHHWHDLAAGLAGMRRVLKPDGMAVVMDTVSPGTPVSHDTFLQAVELLRDPSHVRDYSIAEWQAALRTAGLAPQEPTRSRLRLDFARWVARIGTPDVQIRAIRALQQQAPHEIVERFAIEPDGSFTLDTVLIEAVVARSP